MHPQQVNPNQRNESHSLRPSARRLNGCEGRAQVSSQNTLHPTASRDRLLMMRSSSYSSGGSGGGSDDALGLNCASPMGAPGSES